MLVRAGCTAPHPWTRLLGFFQPVPVSAGRMPLHPQLAPSHKLIMNEVHRPGLVRSCGRLPILAQLCLNPALRRLVPQLQAHLAVQPIDPLRIHLPPCRRMKAICASVNFDLFMVLPRPTARIAQAAKLEFSSKDPSENREAGQAADL